MSKIAVIYWSGSGNTERMANAIAEGAGVSPLHVSDADAECVSSADVVCIGSPALGDEGIDTTEIAPFIQACQKILNGKKLALFGSYGWGGGAWLEKWKADLEKLGAEVADRMLAVKETPGEEDEKRCRDFGEMLTKLDV